MSGCKRNLYGGTNPPARLLIDFINASRHAGACPVCTMNALMDAAITMCKVDKWEPIHVLTAFTKAMNRAGMAQVDMEIVDDGDHRSKMH
jgi:hypothetical protein